MKKMNEVDTKRNDECKRNKRGNNSTKNSGKSKRARRNGKRTWKPDVDTDDSTVVGSNNDFSWYNTLPELTSAAARFPFSRPTGTKITFGSTYGETNTVANDANLFGNYMPGVMAIHWSPTVGVSTDATSPVNILSREIYSFVRHANSGSSNYDSPDLMIYLLAMDSIYSMYTEAVRVYGLINMYTKENRYMPKELITALGYDFDDLKRNTAQFRWYINQVAYKISSFAVPNFMSYYLRHIWMNTGVYLDKDSAKAQMYAFVQDGYYQYQDKIASGNFSGLAYCSLRSNVDFKPMTADYWYTVMTEMCRPILASEDFGIISGDILKAFGADNLFTVSPIPVDLVVVPTHNEEVLSQITNLTVVGRMCTTDEIPTSLNRDGHCCSDIIQSINGTTAEGYLYTRPTFRTWSTIDPQFQDNSKMYYVGTLDKLVTSNSAIPDEADVMVSTRLTNTPVWYQDEQSKPFFTFNQDATCSTEVVSSVHVYAFSHDYVTKEQYLQDNVYTNYGLYTGDDELAWKLSRLSKFDWCPTLPIVTQLKEGNNVQFNGYYQDTDNYAVLDSADLQRMHEAALMSEFYVPQIASISRKPNKSN